MFSSQPQSFGTNPVYTMNISQKKKVYSYLRSYVEQGVYNKSSSKILHPQSNLILNFITKVLEGR